MNPQKIYLLRPPRLNKLREDAWALVRPGAGSNTQAAGSAECPKQSQTHHGVLAPSGGAALGVFIKLVDSAELKGPRTLLMIRPEIFDFESDWGLKLGQPKHNISGMVPTNRRTTSLNDSGPISACFDDDPKLLKCEIAQLRFLVISPPPQKTFLGVCIIGRL